MGILTLYPASQDEIDLSQNLNLDILAIHGLKGDAERTWTHPTTQALWLRDFLPQDLPRARAMVFSYNAKAVFENCTAGILEHARDLLRCLLEKRDKVNERNRPLVLLGHSLGGLVLKQALLLASQQERYRELFKSVILTFFLGTPHRGSSTATYGATLTRIPSALILRPSPVLLKSLRKGNKPLEALTRDFRRLLETVAGRNGEGIEVVSFYETVPMAMGLVLVVEKESALLTPARERVTFEEQIPVPANHRDICRFSDKADETYVSIVKRVKACHGKRIGFRKKVVNRWFVVPQAASMHFTGRDEVRRKLGEKLVEDLYEGGVVDVQKRFVLYGLGGSGKTQICLKFAQDHKDRFTGIFWIDASSKETAEEGFLQIAGVCRLEMRVDSVKKWLSLQDHWLLIIDNADDPNLDICQFFPPGTKGTILVTTRNPDFQKHASAGSCRIDEMAPDDAVKLLFKTAAIGDDGGGKRKEAEAVVNVLGYLALAIIQAGAVIRQGLVSLGGFCDLYWKRKKELLESGRPDSNIEYQRSVYTTWEISTRMIEDLQKDSAIFALELLRIFSFMHFTGIDILAFEGARNHAWPGDGMDSFANSVLMKMMPDGWDPILMASAVGLLISFSLINRDEDGRINIHPLVHEWCRERAKSEERIKAWKTTAITLSMMTTWSSEAVNFQERKYLLVHIDTCLYHGREHLYEPGPDIKDRLSAGVVFAMAYREAFRRNAIELSMGALKCIESIYDPGFRTHITILNYVAMDLIMLGRDGEAIEVTTKMLEKGKKEGHTETIAWAMVRNGECHLNSGKEMEAISICRFALDEYRDELGEENSFMILALEFIGLAQINLEKYKDARKTLENALRLLNKVYGKEHIRCVEVTLALATVYLNMKLYKKAKAFSAEYLALTRKFYGEDNIKTIQFTARVQEFTRQTPFSVLASTRRRARGLKSIEKFCLGSQGSGAEVSIMELSCMEQLAWDYYLCGSFGKARALQEEIVKIRVEKWGPEHEFTIQAVTRLKSIERAITFRKVIYWWVPKGMREKDWLKRQT
ncbi:hypothetical protein BGZ60DRAFT_416641 [Tricladium varicosporioides]|nr:hypothetical protein BGZ60DRAFT_416641 [Hymenoscyphus varicosporioides]